MRKFILSLVTALFLSVPALAAPYRVIDGAGIPVGPVIGIGAVIVLAPDGTPVGMQVAPEGFAPNALGSAITPATMVFYYLDSSCGTAYLLAETLPVSGFFEDQGNLGAGLIYYPATPFQNAIALWALNSNTHVCEQAFQSNLSQPVTVGLASFFSVNRPLPFRAVPWVAPDTDPPTQ
jgi:hypothetical protein